MVEVNVGDVKGIHQVAVAPDESLESLLLVVGTRPT